MLILFILIIVVAACTSTKMDRCESLPTVKDMERNPTNASARDLNTLGEMYHFGCGVDSDFKKAHNYYLQAVQKGSAPAANHLGRLYLNGEGVPVNAKEANKWYKKSAELDPSDLNRCINGQFPDQSFCALLMLAHKSNPEAMSVLGEIYLHGIVHEQKQILAPNSDLAKSWLIKAAEQNDSKACWLLYHSCKKGTIPCAGSAEIEKWKQKGLENGGNPLDFQ